MGDLAPLRATWVSTALDTEGKRDDKPSAPSPVAEWQPLAVCWASTAQPPTPPPPFPWGLSVTDPREATQPPPSQQSRPHGCRDTHSQAGGPAPSSWPHPPVLSLLPALSPPPQRTADLAPSPGLLSHWNGAGCESASRKGHLQPLASDVPAAGPHGQRPQPSKGPVMTLPMTLTYLGT